MARQRYGVKLKGCSGVEIASFPRRRQADQARAAVRAHLDAGGWSGAYTLRCVAVPCPASPEVRNALGEWA